jgi:Crp-like helix-turn-helix domain
MRPARVVLPRLRSAALGCDVASRWGELRNSGEHKRKRMAGGMVLYLYRRDRAIVQIPGQSLVCEVDPLKSILQDYSAIPSLIGAHEQALFAQAQQSAACNATHVIESRFAKWLLRSADLCGSDELPLTQEYIAQMIGVRRTSVTVVARTLQEAGLIRYRRGHIKLVDFPALRESACECYETVKTNYQELLHPAK